jgi:alpha-glucosidase
MQPVKQHTGEANDQLNLHVYAGLTNSSFEFYEDDGSSFDYQKNAFAKRLIEYKPVEKSLKLYSSEGSFKTTYRKVKLVFHGFDTALKSISVNGKSVAIIPVINSFFAGLEKYDPIKDPEPAPEENVLVAEFEYQSKEIDIHW